VRAYVVGFQHGADGVDSAGVAAIVKHWVGYGAADGGSDSHNAYGRYADFPQGDLAYHVRPFLGALAAHAAGVMPTYSILRGATLAGRPVEQVGAAFNRQLLTGLLRDSLGYRGVILTDWGVTNDCSEACRNGVPAGERPSFASVAMPWGVEDLPKVDRFAKAVNAGVDQFGGTEDASILVEAVRAGKVAEQRIDESVQRLLREKFRLGLFENPYVDPAAAAAVVGAPGFQEEATAAQRRYLVLLENRKGILPLGAQVRRVYLHGVDPAVAARYGWTVVRDPAQADVAILRTAAPHETLHSGYVFGAMLHEGSLAFREDDPEYQEIRRVSAVVPTILTVYVDRPAVLPAVQDRVAALTGNFGVSDAALLAVLTGRARPEGKLPFELPSSMQAVEAQRPDLPHDSANPLYPIGFGLTY
jgi:beta-glucosidase